MSDEKVVSFDGSPIKGQRIPEPLTVKAAKELLVKAESGEINGLVAIHHNADETVGWYITGFLSWRTVGVLFSLLRKAEQQIVEREQ